MATNLICLIAALAIISVMQMKLTDAIEVWKNRHDFEFEQRIKYQILSKRGEVISDLNDIQNKEIISKASLKHYLKDIHPDNGGTNSKEFARVLEVYKQYK